MKLAKLFAAIATASVLVMACDSPKVEGSKEVRDLLPTKGQIDTTSYLLGVNFGLVITQNGFGDLNMSQVEKGMKDALNAKEGQPMDSVFVKQFKIKTRRKVTSSARSSTPRTAQTPPPPVSFTSLPIPAAKSVPPATATP